jgi:hypothetical protein
MLVSQPSVSASRPWRRWRSSRRPVRRSGGWRGHDRDRTAYVAAITWFHRSPNLPVGATGALVARAPTLAAVDDAQLVAAVGAILLMSLAVAAIVADIKPRLSRVEPDAVVLLLAYVGAIIAVAVAAQ